MEVDKHSEQENNQDIFSLIKNDEVEAVRKLLLEKYRKLLLDSSNTELSWLLDLREDKTGKTILMVAAERASFEMISLLLEYGADVNAVDSDERTILHYVANIEDDPDNLKIFRLFVANGADIRILDKYDNLAIHYAAKKDNVGIIREYVKAGYKNPSSLVNDIKLNPLMMAAINDSIQSVWYLLHLPDVDPNIYDQDGLSALSHASICENKGVEQMLADYSSTESSVKILKPIWERGLVLSQFFNSIRNGEVENVERFLAENYQLINDIDDRNLRDYSNDEVGLSALMVAVEAGQLNMARMFLEEYKSSPNVTDALGRTAIHYISSCRKNSVEIGNLLLENGADINASDGKGDRPIHIAAANAVNEEVMNFFISNCKDIDVCNDDGKTPLMVATESENRIAIDALTRELERRRDIPRNALGSSSAEQVTGKRQREEDDSDSDEPPLKRSNSESGAER